MSIRFVLIAALGLLACAPSRVRRGDDALAAHDWKLAVAEYDAAAREAYIAAGSMEVEHAEVRSRLALRDKAARVGFAAMLEEARGLARQGDLLSARTLVRGLLAAPWRPRGPEDAALQQQAEAFLDEAKLQYLRSNLNEGKDALEKGYPMLAAGHAISVERAADTAGGVGAEALELHSKAARDFCDQRFAKARAGAQTDPGGAAKALDEVARADWFPEPLRPALVAQLTAAQVALADTLLTHVEASPPAEFGTLRAATAVLSDTPLEARGPLLPRFRAARRRAAEAHAALAAADDKLPYARAAHLAMAAAYGGRPAPADVAAFFAREGVSVNLHPAEVLDERCKQFGGTWLTNILNQWTQSRGALVIDVDLRLVSCPTQENTTSTPGRYELKTIESSYPCRHYDTARFVYIEGTCTQTRQQSVAVSQPFTSKTFEARLEAELAFRWEAGEERMAFDVAHSDASPEGARNGITLNSNRPMVESFNKMYERLRQGLDQDAAAAAAAGHTELATERYLAALMVYPQQVGYSESAGKYLSDHFGAGRATFEAYATGRASQDVSSTTGPPRREGAPVPDLVRLLDSGRPPPLLCCGPAFGEEVDHTWFQTLPGR